MFNFHNLVWKTVFYEHFTLMNVDTKRLGSVKQGISYKYISKALFIFILKNKTNNFREKVIIKKKCVAWP